MPAQSSSFTNPLNTGAEQIINVTDKYNIVRFESLNIHYHSYWTHCDASDNVCLELQNGRYSIFM
jgi:hypothetical protein